MAEDKIDAATGISGHTLAFVNALGLDWSAFHLSETRHVLDYQSFLYPRSDADTTAVDVCFHTVNSANSADGCLDVPHDSAPNGVALEDAMETSSFDSGVVGFVSKSYPFVVAQLGTPGSLTNAYREAPARLDSRYFEARDDYSIAAFHYC